ncbi:streptomycin 6-kinase [Bacillus sp. OV322]|uniref:aminoglycoside phosphotransferase family protein n=1 Tax=Bacillus sp. OV322 TaxID=1882764 RepID=UPI0008ECD0DB|nr:aminoglycoside phosphotransferase family protein [Bacillus sp. OV322]SFB94455.1 streptomycin 6-kinase [Bacillus sp. OV322]
MDLPTTFIDNVISSHGEKGRKWLDDLDGLLQECERRWSLRITGIFDLSYNYVASAEFKNGKEAVVKLAVPGGEVVSELHALQYLRGPYIAELKGYDEDGGILILEKITPGISLAAACMDDDQKTEIAAGLLKQLWRAAEPVWKVNAVRDREKELIMESKKHSGGFGEISAETIKEALQVFAYMNTTAGGLYFLHGDLHHGNILKRENGSWAAIDPKGLSGEREYDTIQFLINELPSVNAEFTIRKRIDIFTEKLNLNRERILLWGFCHAVLASCWSIGSSGIPEDGFIRSARVFQNLIREDNICFENTI